MARRIAVVVTARPSYSRIKTALNEIAARPDLELQLVLAASALLDRYGGIVEQVKADGFDIAAQLYVVLEGENLVTSAKSTGLALVEMATAFDNLRPDAVVTIADRYETLATAAAASYMNIPIAHVQGGEVTGSIDEKVRHAVTKLSDVHFVATPAAYERVVRMGEDPGKVFVTGCPSIDLAANILDSPELDFDPFEKYPGVGVDPDISQGYVVVLQHPVTTEYEASYLQVEETLHAISDVGLSALWFWPNVDAGSDEASHAIRTFREFNEARNIHFFKNMAPEDFLRLLYNSKGIVGNSSVGIRECSFLGVPTVNIGTRQTGRERGRNTIDVGYDRIEIAAAIETHLHNGRRFDSDPIYGTGDAGQRIADLLSEIELTYGKRLTY